MSVNNGNNYSNNNNNSGHMVPGTALHQMVRLTRYHAAVALISCQGQFVDNGNNNSGYMGLRVGPALHQPVPNTDTGFTPDALRLWLEASDVADERMRFAQENPNVVPLPLEPPAMDVREECLLTLALIAERESLQRKWAKMKEIQNYLDLRGGF